MAFCCSRDIYGMYVSAIQELCTMPECYNSEGTWLGRNKVSISGWDVGHYLIGDPAYPLQTWPMKLFSDTGRLTPEQHTNNYRLRCAWSIVEMTFGRFNGWWWCLLKRNDSKLELCKKMALPCCVMYNICEEHGGYFAEEQPCRCVNIQQLDHALPKAINPEGADIRAA